MWCVGEGHSGENSCSRARITEVEISCVLDTYYVLPGLRVHCIYIISPFNLSNAGGGEGYVARLIKKNLALLTWLKCITMSSK